MLRVALIGRIDDAASLVSDFMEQLGVEPVVLGTLPGGGDNAPVERLEELRETQFAVVLPGTDNETPASMLAFGFLLAVLGRGKICFIEDGAARLPAALNGALKVAMDDSGLWKLLLAREMKKAGVDVDLNKAL